MNLFDFELIPDSPNGKDELPRLKSAKMDHNPERHEVVLLPHCAFVIGKVTSGTLKVKCLRRIVLVGVVNINE